MSLYLYAFCRPFEPPHLRGVDKAPIRVIGDGSLAAVASRFTQPKVRPRRRHLLAHDQTVRALADSQDILPVSFGTLASSKDEILLLLDQNRDEIVENLDRLAGRVEIAVKAEVAGSKPFERYVRRYDELRRARDRMIAEGQERNRHRMMEIGKLFEQLRERERDQTSGSFLASLGDVFDGSKAQELKRDEQIFDLSFLVKKEEAAEFEAAFDRAAAALEDDLALHYQGPLPPYSFSTLRLGLAPAVS
ncbi:MAG: GvpL/GvpF family gas vesicle protein [Acidobacteriota bacterium]